MIRSTVAQKRNCRLSEKNCIEVVTKLIEGGIIDVVYTRDGSAYITRAHLKTMVRGYGR